MRNDELGSHPRKSAPLIGVAPAVHLWVTLLALWAAPPRAFAADYFLDHFYTTSQQERDAAVQLGYQVEGTAGFIPAVPREVMGHRVKPVYRLFAPDTGDHFYTTSQAEREDVLAGPRHRDEGILGYVFDTQAPNTTPLYRVWSQWTDDHFYTISKVERDQAITQLYYRDEGVLGFVYASAAADTIPIYRLIAARPSVDFGNASGLTDLIARGKKATLNWSVAYCTAPPCQVTITAIGFTKNGLPNHGWLEVMPGTTTTYHLKAVTPFGVAEADTRVEVVDTPAPGNGMTMDVTGWSAINLANCMDAMRSLRVFSRNVTVNGSWKDEGTLAPNWVGGHCDAGGGVVLRIPLHANQVNLIKAIDPGSSTCVGPVGPDDGNCASREISVRGSQSGPELPWPIS